MKKTLIGCFLTLIGAMGYFFVYMVSEKTAISGWSTPPGRFWTTMEITGMTFPFVLSSALFLIGLIILAVEYFRKEN